MMSLFPICLFSISSHVRGRVIARARRFHMVPALQNPTSISHSTMKEGNFDVKALPLHEVLTTLKDHPYRALSFLKRIEGNGTLLGVKAYRKVVTGLCHEMKMDEAEELVDDMEKNHGIPQDVCVYSAIIEGHRKTMNFPRALQFFNDVVVKQNGEKMMINRVIASSILECCCHMGKFAEAYDLFIQFRELKVSLDRVCYNVAFNALVKLGETQEAIELFRGMTSKGIAPDVVNYTTLIGGCCAHGKVEQALDLVMEMEKEGKTPDIVTYNVLTGGLARNGDVESVNRTLELMESRGLKPTNVTQRKPLRVSYWPLFS